MDTALYKNYIFTFYNSFTLERKRPEIRLHQIPRYLDSLLSVPAKIFAHICLARIKQTIFAKQRPQQSGFTPGRSTLDRIIGFRLLAERCNTATDRILNNTIQGWTLGVNYDDSDQLITDLVYADDVVIFADLLDTLEDALIIFKLQSFSPWIPSTSSTLIGTQHVTTTDNYPMSLSDAVTATHDRPSWRSIVRDAMCPATQAT